jgi:exosortase
MVPTSSTPTSSTRESISKLSPRVRFSLLIAISLLIWSNPLISTFALALRDSRYTHILLILPVSATLLFLDWRAPEPGIAPASSIGLIFLLLSAAVTVIARLQAVALLSDQRLALNMLALVLWWMGAFVVSFGMRAFRRALFPLCFLFWLVPIPDFILNPIVGLLQNGSVASARALFSMIGVPSAQDGTQMTIPGLTIEVAQECSSIRSSMMLVVTTMVLAQMLLRSVWRKVLVIAVALPLSVAKNGLRIFVLGMLTTRVDRSYMTGRLHHQGGVIYFLIALAAISFLIWIARYGDGYRPVLAETDH